MKDELPLDFPLIKTDYDFAESLLKKLKIVDQDLVIGFHPGSATLKNQANRRWEPEKICGLGD
ncbi:MAG: hypothetical protein MZV64_61550 [Ignavibacteriales bacterium]|nr:hypothetical protein [Ignavibacteriales bacterium]